MFQHLLRASRCLKASGGRGLRGGSGKPDRPARGPAHVWRHLSGSRAYQSSMPAQPSGGLDLGKIEGFIGNCYAYYFLHITAAGIAWRAVQL